MFFYSKFNKVISTKLNKFEELAVKAEQGAIQFAVERCACINKTFWWCCFFYLLKKVQNETTKRFSVGMQKFT